MTRALATLVLVGALVIVPALLLLNAAQEIGRVMAP